MLRDKLFLELNIYTYDNYQNVFTGSLPPFRLSNGTFGLFEMYYNETWGSICDDKFDADNNYGGV